MHCEIWDSAPFTSPVHSQLLSLYSHLTLRALMFLSPVSTRVKSWSFCYHQNNNNNNNNKTKTNLLRLSLKWFPFLSLQLGHSSFFSLYLVMQVVQKTFPQQSFCSGSLAGNIHIRQSSSSGGSSMKFKS